MPGTEKTQHISLTTQVEKSVKASIVYWRIKTRRKAYH